jgi:glycosyltransferase involved in cell wall biosynthesis
MKDIILSICIPTRNRKKEVLHQLELIFNSGAELNGLIEVVIGDNSDNPEEELSGVSFNDRGIRVNYIKNEGNIGYSGNINNLINNAIGAYVWLLADDDYLYDNSIAEIIEALQKKSEINYLTFDHDTAINGEVVVKERYFSNVKNTFFVNGNDFLRSHFTSVIFVSINIFNREKLLSFKLDNANLVNDTYQNSILCLAFIEKYGNCFVIDKSLIIETSGNKLPSPKSAIKGNYDYCLLYNQLIKQGYLVDLDYRREFAQKLYENLYLSSIIYIFIAMKTDIDFDFSVLYKDLLQLSPRLPFKLRMFVLTNKLIYDFLNLLGQNRFNAVVDLSLKLIGKKGFLNYCTNRALDYSRKLKKSSYTTSY